MCQLRLCLKFNYFFLKILISKSEHKKNLIALVFPADDKTSHRFSPYCFYSFLAILSLSLSLSRARPSLLSLLLSGTQVYSPVVYVVSIFLVFTSWRFFFICPELSLSPLVASVRVFHRTYICVHHCY